VGRSGIRRGSS